MAQHQLHLPGATLPGAQLLGAALPGAQLPGAQLPGSQVQVTVYAVRCAGGPVGLRLERLKPGTSNKRQANNIRLWRLARPTLPAG